jgi:hypothetical protein
LSLGEHVISESLWQVAGRDQVNRNTQKFFKVDLEAAEVKERCPGQGINENVEVAALVVLSPQDRPKDTCVARLACRDERENGVSM